MYTKYGKSQSKVKDSVLKKLLEELPSNKTKLLSNESRTEFYLIKSVLVYMNGDLPSSIKYTVIFIILIVLFYNIVT